MIKDLFSWLWAKLMQALAWIWDHVIDLVNRFTSWLSELVSNIFTVLGEWIQAAIDWFWGLIAKALAWLADLFLGNNPDLAYNVVEGINYIRTALDRWDQFIPVTEALDCASIYVAAYVSIKVGGMVWRLILAVLP